MEDILRTLSDLQIEALRKGVACDIDLYYNSNKVPTADVKLNYTVTGSISKAYVFSTTLSESVAPTKRDERIAEIKYYLSTIKEK